MNLSTTVHGCFIFYKIIYDFNQICLEALAKARPHPSLVNKGVLHPEPKRV